MKPQLEKAPAHILSISGIQDIIVCPDHRNNWIEEMYVQGKLLDTTQFCNCCTGDCSPFCKNCNQWDEVLNDIEYGLVDDCES